MRQTLKRFTEREGVLKVMLTHNHVGAARPKISHITPKISCRAGSQHRVMQVHVVMCRISVRSAQWSPNCFAASEMFAHLLV